MSEDEMFVKQLDRSIELLPINKLLLISKERFESDTCMSLYESGYTVVSMSEGDMERGY